MHQHLEMKKILARWVSHELSERQKSARMHHARNFLDRWAHCWSRSTSRLITVDEIWISYEMPHTRQSASEWGMAEERAPELPRLATDRRKSMAVVF